MRAEIKDFRVLLREILRSIPMMAIPIDNQDAVKAKVASQMLCGDRHVVEDAKARPGMPMGMVPRRADNAERTGDLIPCHLK